ncbi:aspartate-tRNA ligase [Hypoxylon trugodes]|uniref:aspartate-tRNA ligase n=1 Tax=Hypoxylon trugodes TaxID=326681 RepID=UPI002190D8F3|nr:aspartate-tRNA ligase [Hypoxylon trugodes]KAI1387679.1 aspartate-tRNA ligase [Hypoxylon trugodes]
MENTGKNSVLDQLRLFGASDVGKKVEFDARLHAITENEDTLTLLMRDTECFAMVIPSRSEGNHSQAYTVESVIRVFGVLIDCGKQPFGVEGDGRVMTVHAMTLTVLSRAAPNLTETMHHSAPKPANQSIIDLVSSLTLQERLNNRVLDVRVASTAAIFKIFSGALELAAEFCLTNGFHWTHTPGLINYKIPYDNDYFPLPYFDRELAWLTQTGEVHLQMAMSMDFMRLFEIRNVFRAEKEINKRRLTEFTIFETVVAWERDWTEITDLAESFLVFVIRGLQEREKYEDAIRAAKRLHSSAGLFKLGLDEQGKLPRLQYSEAKELLRKRFSAKTGDLDDMTPEQEANLGALMRTTPAKGPPTDAFIITNYPARHRAFQIHPSPPSASGEPTPGTNSFDIIAHGREICTGYQHIHDYTMLRDTMRARDPVGFDPDSPMWRPYVGAFEAGVHPHGGFAFGMNRVVQTFLGLEDVHEACMFPRNANRISP